MQKLYRRKVKQESDFGKQIKDSPSACLVLEYEKEKYLHFFDESPE